MKSLIYLASPYSTPCPVLLEERVKRTGEAAAKLIEKGHLIFSPIVSSHPIAHLVSFSPVNHAEGELSGWMAYDFAMIDKCDEVWVLMLDGWEKSRGVEAETDYAEERGKPVKFIDPNKL